MRRNLTYPARITPWGEATNSLGAGAQDTCGNSLARIPRQPGTERRRTGTGTRLATGRGAPVDSCCAANCLQERTIMKTSPVNSEATTVSINRTLQEKLALIPATPDCPATFEGSLHPSQAKSDGRLFKSNKPASETSRNMFLLCGM
jgi:hypothetical protein